MNTWQSASAWAGAGAHVGSGERSRITRNGPYGSASRTVGAIDLEANGFFSEIAPEVVDEEGNPVVISEGALALPQMNGSGMVRNLRAAMSLAGTQAD